MANNYHTSNNKEATDKDTIRNLTITLDAERTNSTAKDGTISKLEAEKAKVTEDLHVVLDAEKERQQVGKKIQEVTPKHGRD
jgi:hypothetical protein